MNVVSFDLPSGELLGLHGDLGGIQGNLLRGIDKKTVRREGIKRLHPLFTYVFFSVTHFLKGKIMVQNYVQGFLYKIFFSKNIF